MKLKTKSIKCIIERVKGLVKASDSYFTIQTRRILLAREEDLVRQLYPFLSYKKLRFSIKKNIYTYYTYYTYYNIIPSGNDKHILNFPPTMVGRSMEWNSADAAGLSVQCLSSERVNYRGGYSRRSHFSLPFIMSCYVLLNYIMPDFFACAFSFAFTLFLSPFLVRGRSRAFSGLSFRPEFWRLEAFVGAHRRSGYIRSVSRWLLSYLYHLTIVFHYRDIDYARTIVLFRKCESNSRLVHPAIALADYHGNSYHDG